MSTVNVTQIDITETSQSPSPKGVIQRIHLILVNYVARACEYLKEDMGAVNPKDGDYFPTGGCCC